MWTATRRRPRRWPSSRTPRAFSCRFRPVARLRRQRPALQSRHHAGEAYARVPSSADRDTYAYLRYDPDTGQALLIVANLLGTPQTGTLHFGPQPRAC